MIRKVATKHASHIQRGFIFMRNFLDNIVNLDSYARIYSTTPSPMPSICLFTDFGAAFPSIIHKWLFIVLKHSNLPDGLMHFLEGIYDSVRAVGRAGADVVTLFLIMSGVIQGYSLASFCIVTAFDPFLNMFDRVIIKEKLGIVRACADDAGFALTSLEVLLKVASVFKMARLLAGLTLKFKKCTIVPSCKWQPSLQDDITTWLKAELPDWSDIAVAPQAKYLGTYIGTLTKHLTWRAPAAKWKSRVENIASTGAPPSIAAHLYRTHALPTLSYIGQLEFPSKELVRQEPYVLARLLHVPPNAFSWADFFNVGAWGSARIPSLCVALVVSLVRAAISTTSTWQSNVDMFVDNWRTNNAITIAMYHKGALSPDFWDTLPLAIMLQDAAQGSLDHPLLGNIVPGII